MYAAAISLIAVVLVLIVTWIANREINQARADARSARAQRDQMRELFATSQDQLDEMIDICAGLISTLHTDRRLMVLDGDLWQPHTIDIDDTDEERVIYLQ